MKGKLLTFVLFIVVTSVMLKNLKSAPQALKLKNHFGLPTVENHYGPKTDNIAQYVEANPETFVPMMYNGTQAIKKSLEFQPYPGYENKLNPHFIKSGDMTNLAPSASQIISPQIAGPKLEVRSELHYPAIVGYPTFTGNKKQWHDVTAYNKQTGQIVHDKALVSTPNIVREDHVSNIVRGHQQVIDLNTGKPIIPAPETKKNFGTERDSK
jgi:hypothetical protein